jgi:nicotinamide-nucleotide amidase
VRIHVVGDDPLELKAALREAVADADLVVTSGGLGPTHDDRTVQMVAQVVGLGLRVDAELESQIEAVSRLVAERLQRPYADFADGVTKQARVPEPSTVLGLAGTAPGLVVEADSTPVIILPGPPPELQRLWPRALDVPAVRAVLERGEPPLRRTLRFFGVGESQVAQAFTEAGGDGDGLDVTICARSFEIHVDLLAEPRAEPRLAELEAALEQRLGRHLFSADGRSVEKIVLDRCRELDWTIGTAESCTGGLVAAALTAIPGSSDAVAGGIVSYSDDLKKSVLGVPGELLEEHGAVSAEVAEAMAKGVRERLGVDVAVSVTGVAGPGGGSEDKPVGLVYFHAETPDGGHGSSFSFPGDRDSIRRRSVVASLHLVRRLLEQRTA